MTISKTILAAVTLATFALLGRQSAQWLPAEDAGSHALLMRDNSQIQASVVWAAPPTGTRISSISGTTSGAIIQQRRTVAGTQQRLASVVPIKANKNALMVDALVNGHVTGTFIVDTGATYTSISRQMAEDLGLDLENAERVYVTTVNGRISVPKVRIDRLSLNGLEARNVEATVIDVGHGSSFSGLLGLSFIKQFTLTINPEAGHLIFEQI